MKILYVGCVQLLLLLLFNIPLVYINYNKNYFTYLGMYEIYTPPIDSVDAKFVRFLWERWLELTLDLSYILLLGWLIYSQQTLEERQKRHQIEELMSERTNRRSEWVEVRSQQRRWEEIEKCFILQFDKIVLACCLMISLQQADILRVVFLVFFVRYALQSRRKATMRTHLMVVLALMFIVYIAELIMKDSIEALQQVASIVGMKRMATSDPKEAFNFLRLFWDILIGALLLTFQLQVIYKTKTWKTYAKLEPPYQLKDLDYLKRFFLSNAFFLSQASLLFVAFIPKANLFSLLYIVLFHYFLYNSYQHQRISIRPALLYFFTAILLIRYVYTIPLVHYLTNDSSTLLDLGLNPELNTLKLIANGLVLQFFCAYHRHQNTIYADQQLAVEPPSQLKVRFYTLSLYHLQKFIFLFCFYAAVYQLSYIGFLFGALLFVIIFRERATNWTTIKIPIFMCLFMQILLQYTLQARTLQDLLSGKEMLVFFIKKVYYLQKEWIGIFSQEHNKYWVTLILLHLCELLPLLYSCAEECVLPTLTRFDIDPSDNRIQQSQLDRLQNAMKILKTGPLPSDRGGGVSSESQISGRKSVPESNEYLELEYIYNTLELHKEIDQLFTQIGLEACLFVIVITAYYLRNFFSIFFIFVASFFAHYSRDKVKILRPYWLGLIIVLMLEVIRKYALLHWTPSTWDIRKPWWYYSYTCDEQGKNSFNKEDPDDNISDFMKCQADWNYWLSLMGFSQADIWVQFMAFLLTVCYLRHVDTQTPLTPCRDFTENRMTFTDYVRYFLFCHFYKFALVVFLLIGISSDISSYTEIISCLYFFIAINLLYFSGNVERSRHGIWNKLILFNTIIMILLILYQAPFVKCPVVYEQNRYYYDNNECVYLQQTNHYYNTDFFIFLQNLITGQDSDYKEVSTSDVLYMFTSHILGLNKTLTFRFGFSKETLMALFFFLGLLQRNIWWHPYSQMYVAPYMRRERDKQRENGRDLVEGIHIQKLWNYRYWQAQKEIHDSMQDRVSKRIEEWESILKMQKFILVDENFKVMQFHEGYEEESQQHFSLNEEDLERMRLEEPHMVARAERLVLGQHGPVIHLQDACYIVKEAQDDKQYQQLLLQELLLREEKHTLAQIYTNMKIGLFAYTDLVLTPIEQEIQKVVAERVEYLEKRKLELAKQQEMKSEQVSKNGSQDDPVKETIHAKQEGSSLQSIEEEKEILLQEEQKQPQDEQFPAMIPMNSPPIQLDIELSPLQKPPPPPPEQSGFKSFKSAVKRWLKNLLLMVLRQDSHYRQSVVDRQNIQRKKLLALLFEFVAHYFQFVCFLFIILNNCYNANLLSLLPTLLMFLYGLPEGPIQSKRYWTFLLVYIIIVISLKFLYQMPIFCDSPPYTIIGLTPVCEDRRPNVVETVKNKIIIIMYNPIKDHSHRLHHWDQEVHVGGIFHVRDYL